ncbi:MAG: hypothetical protein HGB12_09885, partial [Bacteroidetes bacterium]|nr:hypothetical protein [Bacteroidota bacterium]
TNSITADFSDTFTSGNLTVYGTNACGNGTASTGTAITINPPSVGGTAASNQTICGGSQPANITLSGNTGTIQWQSSPDNSTYTDISGATASPLTGAQMGTITATTYYRAVVTNGVCASAYSNVVTVITAVNDIDGNTYNTVSIGTQCWMKENLKTTHYSNGTSIQIVTDNTTWKNLATGARCYYNNDSMAYKATYGGLYNWYAVMNGEASSNANPSGVQGICPTGWHVPSDTEWGIMEVYLDNTVVASTADVWKGTDIGNKLKISGSCITCPNSPDGCWCSNSNANNSSNFTAFGSGCRYNHDGSFSNLGYQSSYWTSTASSTTMAWQHDLIYYLPQVQKSYYYKQRGYSLRCVKN